MKKIFTCERCHKKVIIGDEKDHLTQLCYRTVEKGCVWESEWTNLCGDCYNSFKAWYIAKQKGGDR